MNKLVRTKSFLFQLSLLLLMYLHASNSNQFGIASLSKLWLPVDIVLLPIFLFVNNDMNVLQ